MTLYGLDLVRDQDGKYHLLEINGISSGMKGFEYIYGDNRVEEKVFEMLQKRYGNLTVNDGTYAELQYKKEHPFKYALDTVRDKIPFLRKKNLAWLKLRSLPTARTDWVLEEVPYSKGRIFPFDPYIGQESAVLSTHYNEELSHPLVNPFLTEAIAANKFFTDQVLRNSSIGELVPPSTLLGLGFTHEEELAELLESAPSFVIKPILGTQGRGLEFLTREDAKKHQLSRGPIELLSPLNQIKALYANPEDLLYVEDLAKMGLFSFQHGLGIIQPFIESKRLFEGMEMYSCIRAIVCNEQFVDAYLRVSPLKKANLSQGAQAYPCKDKDEIVSLSEKIVAVFEEECFRYDPKSFRQELYGQYIESRGKTTLEMKNRDIFSGLSTLLVNVTSGLERRLP
ncbi:MAG: hypothetical protein Q7S55_03825 [Nanoarchaeota archaeon]|nr:hypothetical protein [Nanoarchaeota archaeon]